MKKDLFGYENQGKKYDLYRPQYPKTLLEALIKRIKHRNRYIDVATGTGQILFQLAPYFSYSQGIDISKKMIDVCLKKKQQNILGNVHFICQDFIKQQYYQKFDLITIGQALHWLPIRQCLEKSKELLDAEGVLAVYGYVLDGLEGQTMQETEKYKNLYKQFYDNKIKQNFDFDRDELHNHYSQHERYPFEQIFPKTTREVIKIPIIMNKYKLISYLKTYSGYNTYLERYLNQQDPIIALQQQIDNNVQIKCIFDYFSIICQF